MTASLHVLVANANAILSVVVIPLLVMLIFTRVRKGYGNAVTAMADVLVFLIVVDLSFVVQPQPWIDIVHHSIASFFPALFLTLALLSALVFGLGLKVEAQLLRYWSRSLFPGATGSMPPAIAAQGFPYFGVAGCWCWIACVVALSALPFVLR